jgi:uncharacterized protein YaiE (UPF0345 family)
MMQMHEHATTGQHSPPDIGMAASPAARSATVAHGRVKSLAIGAQTTGAQSIGALAIGALAFGALAIGAVAIGRLVIGRVRLGRVEIDELVVRSLRVTDSLHAPLAQHTEQTQQRGS